MSNAGAAGPPDCSKGGDAEEVPLTEEGGLRGSVGPEERVIGDKDGRQARDVVAGEGVPSVEEPGDGRLDLWTREEGVSDVLGRVRSKASRGGAGCGGGVMVSRGP